LDTLGEATRDFQEQLVSGTGAINLAETAIYGLADAIDVATEAVRDVQTLITALDLIVRNLNIGLDGLAGVFDIVNDAIIRSIPGLREAIFAYEQLLKLAGQYVDSQAGQRNFGSNYASQEKALFEAAGGYTPYKQTRPDPTPGPTPKPTRSKGADAAAKAAEREAERVAKTLRDREQLVKRLEQQIKIQSEVTELGKEEQRLQLDILEINQRYDNLLVKETDELIRQNTERARALELELAREQAMDSMMSAAQSDFTNFLKQQPEYAKAFNNELTDTEQLLSDAYGIVANGLTSGIKGLIDGTKEWGDVLGDIASQLGNMFLQAGFSALGAGLKIPGFADGGTPPVNQVSVVGERGPELFKPTTAGTVVSNEQSRAQLNMYSPGNATDGPQGPMNVNMNYSGPTMAFDDKRYLPIDAVPAIIKDAAKQGEQRALSSMRNKVSTRNRVGI
jgi:hypothetical protein